MFGSRVGFSRTADRTVTFTVGSNPRWRLGAIFKNSNDRISETHYPIHFMYVHMPSDSIMAVDAYYMIGDWTLNLFHKGGYKEKEQIWRNRRESSA